MSENTDNTAVRTTVGLDGLRFEQTGWVKFTLKVRQACNAGDYTIHGDFGTLTWTLVVQRYALGNDGLEVKCDLAVLDTKKTMVELIPALRADDLKQVAETFGLDNPEEEIKSFYEDFLDLTLAGSGCTRETGDGCVSDIWVGPYAYSRLASEVQEQALGYDDENDGDDSTNLLTVMSQLDENGNLENEETDNEL